MIIFFNNPGYLYIIDNIVNKGFTFNYLFLNFNIFFIIPYMENNIWFSDAYTLDSKFLKDVMEIYS